MDYVSLGLVSEELEYVDTSLRVIMSVHAGLNCLSLLARGEPRIRSSGTSCRRHRGRKIATYGLTEPPPGSDVRGIQTVAVKKGDRYVLTGEKMWISLADVADNFLVFAWTDLEKKKQRDPSGISAFIVERSFKGFSSGTLKEKWGILAGNTGFFKMEEVEVPEENLVGRPGEGFKIAMFALDQGRYTVAAGATGLIRACRDASARYAKERKTFGVASAEHQLVKEMIAQMESDYQAARLLWLRSGCLKNQGRRNTRETGLAKWFATVASERAAGDAVQVHGANGYSDEYPVGRFYRNCKGAVIYEGHARDPQDHAGRLRARLPGDKLPTRCELPRKFRAFDELDADLSSSSSAWSNRPRSPARTRWARATGTNRIRSQSRRCGEHSTRCRSTARSSSARGSATRRRCSTSASRSACREGRTGRAGLPRVDIAVDPLEGTNLCATGAPNAMAVLAASEGGGLLHAPDLYMEKLVVGASSKSSVSLDAPVADNLTRDRAQSRP